MKKSIFEKALILERRLNAMNLNAKVGVLTSAHRNKIEQSLYVKSYSDKTDYYLQDKSIDEIIEIAKTLVDPSFIKVKKICIDIIDREVFLDKTESFIVKSILSKDIVLTKCDKELEIKNLWIKE